MGFFSKILGSKDTPATKTAAPRGATDLFGALSLHCSGDLQAALEAYPRLGEEKPDHTLAPFFNAAALAGMGRVAEGAQLLRDLSRRTAEGGEPVSHAVARDLFALLEEEPTLGVPALGEIIVAFGDGLKSEGFVQESAVCFEIAAGLLPEHATVLHRLGDTLHDLRAYEYADSVLARALELAPNHWGALYTRAVLFQDLGRFDEAIALYEKAVVLDPDHVKCRNNYGAALMLAGRLEEALAQCTLAAELDPDFTLAKVNLGNIHLLRKEYDPARTCFSDALALDDRLAPAYFGLGAVEQSSGGDANRARDLYLKAIELNPDNPQFHQALGDLLATEGKTGG